MEVPATGMGAAGPERSVSNSRVAPPANVPSSIGQTTPLSGDSVAALLGELSKSDLSRLLEIVEGLPRSGEEAQVEELLRAAVEAVAAGIPSRALDQVRQLAGLNPARAETLASSPGMASIRPELERLLSQLTAAAKLRAEGQLGDATQRLETAIVKDTSAGEVRPEILLLVATSLIEAGGLANYVRSDAVSAALIDQCRWAPAEHAEPAIVIRPAADRRVSVGLLVSVWLPLGIASAVLCWWVRSDYLPIVCAAWAGGLVVLIGARAWRRPRGSSIDSQG
jgi:hypothetical protein